MKQIIIFLLVIILLVIGYGQYKQYKRFTLENYEYKANESVDLHYHDKSFLLDYYEAVEELNNYIIMQWSANDIDVRTPENDDEESLLASKAYTKKLAKVKFYEDQLLKSAEYKTKGMTNQDIKLYEEVGITLEKKQKNKLFKMFKEVNLSVGDRNAYVYELQKLLSIKGYEIPLDGVFETITSEALMAFETKNGFYADGKLDLLTLEKLVE